MDNATLQAIKEHNLIFVSAQPDQTYFHWQVELYLHQFKKHNIQSQCYAVFGYRGKNPSEYSQKLAKDYNIICYKDESNSSYIPTIRPRLLEQFFRDYPDLGKNVFYHDSDIFIVKLPKFENMLNSNMGYVSDTVSYIGYKYISDCSKRYKEKYPDLPDDDIFHKMCEVAKIDPELVKANEANSGGAQYLLKNIDSAYWKDVLETCIDMNTLFKDYEKKYPIQSHLQFWTNDMWAVLWNYWKRGGKTVVDKELEFSWATGTVAEYYSRNIFHLAGVTDATKANKFYKAQYTTKNVFEEYKNNNSIFDHIDSNSATYEYVKVLKDYANNYEPPKGLEARKNTCRFLLTSKHSDKPGLNVYTKSEKLCCGKPVWYSADSKFLMFFNNSCWILTYTVYEKEIGEKCGGICSNVSSEAYLDNWTENYSCEFID